MQQGGPGGAGERAHHPRAAGCVLRRPRLVGGPRTRHGSAAARGSTKTHFAEGGSCTARRRERAQVVWPSDEPRAVWGVTLGSHPPRLLQAVSSASYCHRHPHMPNSAARRCSRRQGVGVHLSAVAAASSWVRAAALRHASARPPAPPVPCRMRQAHKGTRACSMLERVGHARLLLSACRCRPAAAKQRCRRSVGLTVTGRLNKPALRPRLQPDQPGPHTHRWALHTLCACKHTFQRHPQTAPEVPAPALPPPRLAPLPRRSRWRCSGCSPPLCRPCVQHAAPTTPPACGGSLKLLQATQWWQRCCVARLASGGAEGPLPKLRQAGGQFVPPPGAHMCIQAGRKPRAF